MNNDLISRSALKEEVKGLFCPDGFKLDFIRTIDNAPTVTDRTEEVLSLQNTIAKLVEGIAENARPQGEWYDFIPNCLKARHGEYVLYKVDFLLDNLAREVNIMESARRMKGCTYMRKGEKHEDLNK